MITTGWPEATTPAGPATSRSPLLDVVTDLAADVDRASFPLDLPGADARRALRRRLATRLTGHLLPRLRRATAPAVVVVGGSTGAGKSTIVNAVVGREVSRVGVLRPTTHRPLLVVHPDDRPLLAGHPLTDLAEVVEDDGVPAGLVLLDAPDLDSVSEANRDLAADLLQVADLWVFVTTATRYGDALPWRLLQEAQQRGVATAVVLGRVRAEVLTEVRHDLLQRLDHLGLGSSPLFVVPDAGPLSGPLPEGWLGELTGWFGLVAARQQTAGIVQRTMGGAWPSLVADLLTLAEGMAEQARAAHRLRELATDAVAAPAQQVVDALGEGGAARGAPTARWVALAAGSLAPLVAGVRARHGWRGRALAARDHDAELLAQDVREAVVVLVAHAVDRATAAVRHAWDGQVPGAAALLSPSIGHDDAHRAAEQVVQDWAAVVDASAADLPGQGALGPAGLAALQAGAVGVEGAAEVLVTLLGDDARAALAHARTHLTGLAAAEVERVAGRYVRAVDALDLRAAAAGALRARAAELGTHR